MKNEFKLGLKDGIPIALGYFAVSFGVGIMAIACGLNVFQGMIMSLSNVTSAGEFAGLKIILTAGTITEMLLTEFIINLRYGLMSLSLSQKLSEDVKLWQRFVIAFANTDEIFAVAMAHHKKVTFFYMVGLESLPILGWTLGTVLGSIASNLMPLSIRIATGVALYGMFIAIVIPEAKKSKAVSFTVAIAVLISSIFYYVPIFAVISEGISIILSTVIAAALAAVIFPIDESDGGKE